MSRRTTILFGCLGIICAVAIAGFALFFFRGSDTPPPASTDAGIAIDPSATDPAGVATSVISGVFTWQPAVQDSPWEALHDQHESLTGPMATAAAAPPEPAPQPISEWSAWSRSGDVVTAVAKVDDEPTNGIEESTVPVVISQTVQHTNSEITPYATYTAIVDLERTRDGWKVSNYRLTDVGR